MFLLQLAISLTLGLLMVCGSMSTASSQMTALRSAAVLRFYARDMAQINLTLQKIVGKATSFNIYMDSAAAINPNTASLTSNGTAVRLTYTSPRAPGILYFTTNPLDATTQCLVYQDTGTGKSLYIATDLATTSNSFSLSDTAANDATGTATGLLVITLTTPNPQGKQVVFYAERF